MNRILRLLTIYIFLNYCSNALAQTENESTEEADNAAETYNNSVENDRVEDNRGDYDNQDYDEVNNKYKNLMALDYYNGAMGSQSREDNADSPPQLQILKSNSDSEQEGGTNIVVLDNMDIRNYRAEMKAGNKADVLGSNPHYYQPDVYPDFSRRFVLQYPYREVENKNKDVKERKETNELIPKLASPEFVLAVAQKSALLDAATPKNPTEKLITKDILRTGNYWNAVWKEDVNPLALRSNRPKKLESIRAEIPPGSTLYDLVSKIKDISPTLLYVMDDKKA